MKRTLVLVFALCMTANWANADADCGMVFGSDWAFAFSAPTHWASLCHAQKPAGPALTLWPQGTSLADAPAMIYVTVNEKYRRSLALFAADDQQRFRSEKPNATVRFEPGMTVGVGGAALAFRATDAQNQELIAYLEGPTRFFVVVMSARSAKSFDEYQGGFKLLLNSFVLMKVTSSQAK